MRVAIGGIVHETNTYCKEPTQLAEFRIWRGEEITERSRGVRSYLGGMIDAAGSLGATLVPTYFANATPSGTIQAQAYQTMKAELLEGIRAALPVDAVALALHGAGVAQGADDLEGDLCQAVRALVGPQVKITLSLDLHGNLTQAMADSVECLFGVHYYPHTDMYERGHEQIMILPQLLSGALNPVTHIETVPMLLPTSTTNLPPAKAVVALCRQIEERNGLIDCTFFHGFPYTDIPQVGVHIVATANGDRDKARRAAKEVAAYIWAHREDFRPITLSPAEAIAQALAIEGGPIVINDTADNPGGGSPGDATHLLRAMIEADLQNACFGFIYDPAVAEQAHAAGVGQTIRVSLGGKYDELHGAPLVLDAYVKCLTDGQFVYQAPMSRGAKVNFGKMARLQVGGVDILVSSVRSQTLDPEIFLIHGIAIDRMKIVALKSSQHFRAGFEPVSKAIVTADSPGLTTLRIAVFPRTRHSQPMWPLHPEANYSS